MSALMPGSSKGFGIGTGSLGSSTGDCIENVRGFLKKCKVWYQDQQIQQEKARPIQHFGKAALVLLSRRWLQPSPGGTRAALPGAAAVARRPCPVLGDTGRGRAFRGHSSSRDTQSGENSWTAQGSHAPATKNKCMGWKTEMWGLLILNKYHQFLSSLDSWLALIWFSFSKDNENSRLPNKKSLTDLLCFKVGS